MEQRRYGKSSRWVLSFTTRNRRIAKIKKRELTEYAKEKLKTMNSDFLKDYPDVTRVEVITDAGREFVRYQCSKVQVSLQDNGRTIKVFLSSQEN